MRPYVETDTRLKGTADEADTELIIDAIADDGWRLVAFEDVNLDLVLTAPADAFFVEHGARNNYTRLDGSTGAASAGPLRALRIHLDSGNLLSGPLNGATFYVGIRNPTGSPLEFTGVVGGKYRAEAESCQLRFTDMTNVATLPGYLGR